MVVIISLQDDTEGMLSRFSYLVGLPLLVYKLIGLMVPRLRDAGWSPWLLLLIAVPGINALFVLALYLIPSRKDESSKEVQGKADQASPCLNDRLEFDPKLPTDSQ